MFEGKRWTVAGFVVATAVTLAGSGCRVDETHKGDGKDVKIATPFGGMHIKTDDAASEAAAIGMPVYPGATVEKKDHDSGSADVNMSFGDFQMRVKVVSYRTGDAPPKVEDFYRKALARYGDVILCHGEHVVGTPTQTSEGLTCADSKENTVSTGDTGDHNLELKTGSKQHQHVVGIDPDGGGTKFALVVLDLPGKMFSGSGTDERQ